MVNNDSFNVQISIKIIQIFVFEISPMQPTKGLKQRSGLKLPNLLNLGALLPGQFGQAMLPLQATSPTFLTLQLSNQAIARGYFLLKQASNDCKQQMNIVLKPNVITRVFIGAYANQAKQSKGFQGELVLNEGNLIHKIKLVFFIEIPKIFCKKLMADTENKCDIIRIVMNKAVSNQTHIKLVNKQKYQLCLQASLLNKPSFNDKESPFNLEVNNKEINVDGGQQFHVTIAVSTNICFKNDFKGLKKVELRNVLLLRTNSILLWCVPFELIIVFVKQPQFKQE